MHRRRFLQSTAVAFGALVASGGYARVTPNPAPAYGALREDPAGLLSLPPGFRYRILSRLGDAMVDGGSVPDKADGMGCIALGGREIVLVRNHELVPDDASGGRIARGYGSYNGELLPGGTTHIVLDQDTLAVKRQFRSLGGTVRNCSGGVTPWGSWLSCEEFSARPGQAHSEGFSREHGWVFEVPAAAKEPIDAEPLRALGRFNHEAACVDPRTGYVYLTEDRDDSVLYRFLPDEPGRLRRGGLLQAMRIEGLGDTRNWSGPQMPVGQPYSVTWIDLDEVESPLDDLRYRAAAAGASLIARGEGIHMGSDAVFVCSTSGGSRKLGQVLRLTPGRGEDDDHIALFFESQAPEQYNFGDNLTVAPDGHLIVCEDQYTDVVDNHLRVISPDGKASPLARLHLQTELAGACFSPDGRWLFVNAYAPTHTFAITGPWAHFA